MANRRGKIKPVYFNPDTEPERWQFASTHVNFSEWVKLKIDLELAEPKKANGIDPEIRELIEKLVESKLAGKIALAQLNSSDTSEDVIDELANDVGNMF